MMSSISSKLVEILLLETFLVRPPFSVTSPLRESAHLSDMVRQFLLHLGYNIFLEDLLFMGLEWLQVILGQSGYMRIMLL